MSPTHADPSRWAFAAAYAVPLCVLPSAIWRLTAAPGSSVGWYLTFLSVLSMALAILTLGLVHKWGQRLPRWLGGRPIPPLLVTRLAIGGGLLLVAICAYFLLNQAFHFVDRGWSPTAAQDAVVHDRPGWEILRYYVPLLAWGPLLIAVALDYRRRARR
ncbi:hypothetical protein JNW91_03980 [Micromonospora sp. STR1_7]|uniref:DUF3995 domain-containing protein n=1 Tax=Micromonospora parastrephiae TaxID=2806101 RepID=A0ABS1XPC2_9ACTN|nr:hypothetical protein [Micromonospora parastrephiae]MBM0231108.1 hypothetical protein [Micromonospora parastrephiae]